MSIRALAIETSSRVGSVALAEDGKSLAEETFEHGLVHAAKIVPAIDALCKRLGWGSGELREIYVSAGPGSFTGLRIGITLAKTLAFATAGVSTGAKVVAVPSVRVLVENSPLEARNVIVVLDAKREQIFTASFVRDADRWNEVEPAQLSSLRAMLDKSPRPVHLIGEGIPYHRKFIDAGDGEVILTDESLWRPRAGVVARLGFEKALRGEFTEAMKLVPIYIRRPEAEEKFEKGK
jgi:tRNA threonylcarbamoyladenosine biosynthesis protein TsaB